MMSDADFKALVLGQGAQAPAPRANLPAPTGGIDLGTQASADTRPQPADTKMTGNHTNDGEKALPSTPVPAGNTEAERLALWMQKMEVKCKEMDEKEAVECNKYNRTVIISPLPDTATAADILPRIRGGVDSCYVSEFEGNRVAVVTFKLPADAITYVEFCAESPIWGLWTFRVSRAGVPFTWDRRAEVKLFKAAPGMELFWNRAEIPLMPRPIDIAGSRCLVYPECKPHEVAALYRALGLHYSQHQRDQVEGMWLDGPVRYHNGEPAYGSLHIWYTSIRAAKDAQMRWGGLQFEYDPCSQPLPTLMLHLEEIDDGSDVCIFKHHEPFVDLIELCQKSVFNGLIQGDIDPAPTYWRSAAARQPPGEGASLTSRLQWSLQNHGGDGGGGQPLNVSTITTPHQPAAPMPAAAQLTDPFIDSRPLAAGIPPQLRNDGTATSYNLEGVIQGLPLELQPFATDRAVPDSHFLSPVQTYVARSQERQALGFPPYNAGGNHGALPYRNKEPSRPVVKNNETNKNIHAGFDGAGFGGVTGGQRGTTTTTIDTNIDITNTNNTSNLGGNNNPQSGRQPHPGSDDS